MPANTKHPKIRLAGIGTLKMRGKSRFEGLPKTAEVMHKAGGWFISITFNCEPKREGGSLAIGLDWGVENFATYIDHQDRVTTISNPRLGKKLQTKIKQAHQALSRTQKGSQHRKQAIGVLSKLYQKLANQRKDFIHKTSAEIVNQCVLIATEILNIKNMTRKGGLYKKGLNREILNTLPATFIKLLRYKAEEAGIDWVDVPTRSVKPSQTCYLCGAQVKKLLSERWHSCPCGAECSRDENASRVILNWALTGRSSQELAEAWRGNTAPLKCETASIISA